MCSSRSSIVCSKCKDGWPSATNAMRFGTEKMWSWPGLSNPRTISKKRAGSYMCSSVCECTMQSISRCSEPRSSTYDFTISRFGIANVETGFGSTIVQRATASEKRSFAARYPWPPPISRML